MEITGRLTVATMTLAVALTACTSSSDPQPETQTTPLAPVGIPSPEVPEARPLTRPDSVVVDNLGTGRYKRILRRSQRDLEKIGLWRRLTKQLFVVEMSARAGRQFIPEDGHLADAFRTLDIREDQGGVLCDITFYPDAMSDDLARWTGYYGSGRTAEAPPTMRQLWTSVLGHELAHCLRTNNTEADARAWEAKVLIRLREAGLE